MATTAVQNINDKPYRDYLRIYTTEDLFPQLIDALDIIWEHPGGRKKIMQSYEYKGTLEIVYDNNQSMVGYYCDYIPDNTVDKKENEQELNIHNRITIPQNINNIFSSENGELFRPSLHRAIAHELYHASDKYINSSEISAFKSIFNIEKINSFLSSVENNLEVINRFIPENYSQFNDDEKFAFIDDIYENTNCAALIAQNNKNYHDYLKNILINDQKIATYIKRFETPAIDFANEIIAFVNTKREYQEPQRINDYTDFTVPNYEIDKAIFLFQFAIKADEILECGGKEACFAKKKQQYAEFVNNITSGALVKIEDTPQAQVEKIELIGKTKAEIEVEKSK